MLTVFEISNTQLGSFFSVYGLIAMISYLFGGQLADRFSARKLMAIALWLTAAGGLVMSFVPSPIWVYLIYGLWGFSTIFLFWAALIRATREWGGDSYQGRAFGWLIWAWVPDNAEKLQRDPLFEVGAAGIGVASFWLRGLVAISVGVLADRFMKVRLINIFFAVIMFGSMLTGTGMIEFSMSLTGTAVGITSFLGYTPEVFMGPWMGYLLDNHPGAVGHQYVFLVLAGFSLVGLVSGLLFIQLPHTPIRD